MHHVGIGDGQDHPRRVFAEPTIDGILQVDHVRLAIGAVLARSCRDRQ